MKSIFLAITLCSFAFAQRIEMVITSTDFNPNTHRVDVHLLNESTKTVTAYVLQFQEFDAAGKQIYKTQTGWDNGINDVRYPNDPRKVEYIPPGESKIVTNFASVDTSSLQVSVVGVVYNDLTAEGDYSGMFFAGRANSAKEAKEAIAILTPYPTTPEAMQSALARLRAQAHQGSATIALIANHMGTAFSAPAIRAKLTDASTPITIVPTKEQMDAVIADLKANAAFYEAHSIRKAEQ